MKVSNYAYLDKKTKIGLSHISKLVEANEIIKTHFNNELNANFCDNSFENESILLPEGVKTKISVNKYERNPESKNLY